MILTINLAPEISREPTLHDLLPTILAVGIVISASYYAPIYYAGTIEAETAEITQKTETRKQELAILQADLKKAKELSTVMNEINARKSVIQNLALGRQHVVATLEKLQDIQPEKMWITYLDSQGSSMSIKGWATDHNVISEYVRRLQATNNESDIRSIDTKTFTPIFIENENTIANESQSKNNIKVVKFTNVSLKESVTKPLDTSDNVPIQAFELDLTNNLSVQ
jgi:Tfp pilus assembly protein PilN